MIEPLGFEYSEDREFFANLLTGGDVQKLESEFSECFDWRKRRGENEFCLSLQTDQSDR